MSKNAVIGGVVALAMVCILAGAVISYEWNTNGNGPEKVPFGPNDDGTLQENSLNYQLFEKWGPVMLVLGSLMFGAIIAGVCISKEKEKDEEGEE